MSMGLGGSVSNLNDPKGDSSGRMTSIPSMTFSVFPRDITVRSFSAVVTCILGPSAIF